MADDDVVILGAANMRERTRTLKSGEKRSKYTVEITGDSIVANFDPRAWGKPLADAIAEFLRERISGITAVASAGALAARARAKKAFEAGRPWAMKQYAGGKIGAMPPAQTDRKFNDSGRLAASIVVAPNEKDGAFTINMAANRFKPELVKGGAAGVTRIFESLKQYVPELGDVSKLMDSIPIRNAMKQTIADNLFKAVTAANVKAEELRRQYAQQKIAVFKAVAGLVL